MHQSWHNWTPISKHWKNVTSKHEHRHRVRRSGSDEASVYKMEVRLITINQQRLKCRNNCECATASATKATKAVATKATNKTRMPTPRRKRVLKRWGWSPQLTPQAQNAKASVGTQQAQPIAVIVVVVIVVLIVIVVVVGVLVVVTRVVLEVVLGG